MGEPCKILIVEDELLVAEDLATTLEKLGYTVIGPAQTGARAVRLAEQAKPDLVLMDIQLVGTMNGITAAAEIRRCWQIPVVFVTANTDEEMVRQAKSAGPYGFLSKPFRHDELNGTIRIALHQHRLTQELFAEQNWLTILLDSLSDGVIATDVQGQVRYLNPAAAQLTGWTAISAQGKGIEEVYPLMDFDGQPIATCQLRKALQSQGPVEKQRFLLKTKDGRTMPVEDAAAPFFRRSQMQGAATIFRDISERFRQEREEEAAREQLEQQVQVTTEALGQTREELRGLSGHLLSAQEEERRRIARELHDDLGQRMALLSYQLDDLTKKLPPVSAALDTALQNIRHSIEALATSLRDVSHRLHPSILTDLGLPAALRALVAEQREQGQEVSLTLQDLPDHIPWELATALYRISQEALRNAAKHAAEAPIHLTLQGRAEELKLRIEDAGPGFDLQVIRGQRGLGLLSMQERARSVGGSLLLRTQQGQGTLVLVRVPVPSSSAN